MLNFTFLDKPAQHAGRVHKCYLMGIQCEQMIQFSVDHFSSTPTHQYCYRTSCSPTKLTQLSDWNDISQARETMLSLCYELASICIASIVKRLAPTIPTRIVRPRKFIRFSGTWCWCNHIFAVEAHDRASPCSFINPRTKTAKPVSNGINCCWCAI